MKLFLSIFHFRYRVFFPSHSFPFLRFFSLYPDKNRSRNCARIRLAVFRILFLLFHGLLFLLSQHFPFHFRSIFSFPSIFLFSSSISPLRFSFFLFFLIPLCLLILLRVPYGSSPFAPLCDEVKRKDNI